MLLGGIAAALIMFGASIGSGGSAGVTCAHTFTGCPARSGSSPLATRRRMR